MPDHTVSESTPGSTAADQPVVLAPGRALIVWSVWAGATLAVLAYVAHYGRNVPMWEDLLVVPVMTGNQPLSLHWAAAQMNEHRAVIPKLILAGLLRTTLDFRTGLYLNVALMSAAAAAMLVRVRRLRGSSRIVDAVLPLSILSIGGYECFLIGFALNLVMTAWMSCELIGIVSRATHARLGGRASRWGPGWYCCRSAEQAASRYCRRSLCGSPALWPAAGGLGETPVVRLGPSASCSS